MSKRAWGRHVTIRVSDMRADPEPLPEPTKSKHLNPQPPDLDTREELTTHDALSKHVKPVHTGSNLSFNSRPLHTILRVGSLSPASCGRRIRIQPKGVEGYLAACSATNTKPKKLSKPKTSCTTYVSKLRTPV